MGPHRAYQALILARKIHPDVFQERAVQSLQRLHTELSRSQLTQANSTFPLGVYLHGGVGRGKTMLMDIFYDSLPSGQGLRVHSHAFFLELHARIHAQKVGGAAALANATAHALGSARVLCLDELEVSDIADAILLRRVFSSLCASQIALVSTSNSAPQGLYRGGLNREYLFLPCERELLRQSEVVCLDESSECGGRDYRSTAAPSYPLLLPNQASVEATCAVLAATTAVTTTAGPTTLQLAGFSRSLYIPHACGSAYARFTFAELCAGRLSAADYLALAAFFKAIIITNVPSQRSRDASRRLITLVDILYEERVLLLLLCREEGGGAQDLESLLAAEEEEEEEAAYPYAKASRLGHMPLPGTDAAAVRAQGGASGRSVLHVGSGESSVEWSATGRSGASLANLGRGANSFLHAAKKRCNSRLRQMLGWEWVEECVTRRGLPLEPLRALFVGTTKLSEEG